MRRPVQAQGCSSGWIGAVDCRSGAGLGARDPGAHHARAMTIWGKLAGAGLGFVIGGPIGGLLGAFAGHFAYDRHGAPLRLDPQVAFTAGLVALAAKMAKADGVVTRDEVAAFRQIVKVEAAEVATVTRLFDLARETTAGFEAYAYQVAELFSDNRAVLEDVVDGLFHIAKADGAVHEAEQRYLAEVARIFAFSDADFRRIQARHVRMADDPYVVLGAERNWDNDRLRRHWRALVAENHPDRHIAMGMPPEAVAIATRRLAAINAAWDRVAQERKIT
jgi:DnaJ like chaperone protein